VIYPDAFGRQQGSSGHVSSSFYERSFIVTLATMHVEGQTCLRPKLYQEVIYNEAYGDSYADGRPPVLDEAQGVQPD